jgi:hypothetical protein
MMKQWWQNKLLLGKQVSISLLQSPTLLLICRGTRLCFLKSLFAFPTQLIVMSLCVRGRVPSSLESNRSNRQSAACWLRLLLQWFVFDCDPILQLCTEIVENRASAIDRFRFRRPRALPAARAPDHRLLLSAKPHELFRELDPIVGARPPLQPRRCCFCDSICH